MSLLLVPMAVVLFGAAEWWLRRRRWPRWPRRVWYAAGVAVVVFFGFRVVEAHEMRHHLCHSHSTGVCPGGHEGTSHIHWLGSRTAGEDQ